jgi:hypothetical protein
MDIHFNHDISGYHIISEIGIVVSQDAALLLYTVTGIKSFLRSGGKIIHHEMIRPSKIILRFKVKAIKVLLVIVDRNACNQIPVFGIEQPEALRGITEYFRIPEYFGIGVFVEFLVNVTGELKQGALHILTTKLRLLKQGFIEVVGVSLLNKKYGYSIERQDKKKYESRYKVIPDHTPFRLSGHKLINYFPYGSDMGI